MAAVIVGILNATPDSFFDGGKFFELDNAIRYANRMVSQGADIIDIGGESSRPGSTPVSVKEEMRRVLPIVKKLQGIKMSVDTYKPQVAEECLKAGASIINDITGLNNPKMARICAQYKATVVVMHMKGTPQDMQKNPTYEDVVDEIKEFFKERIKRANDAGICNIILDPGIGFGKTLDHNLEILRRLGEFKALRFPVMVGTSRKSFIGQITGADNSSRLPGTIAANVIAILNGADMLRVHDVKECKQMVEVVSAVDFISDPPKVQ